MMASTAASSQERLWTRDFSLIWIAALMIWSSASALLPVMPVFLYKQFDALPLQVGLVSSLFSGASIIARLFTGYGIERWGRRWIMLAAVIVWVLMIFCYSLPTSLLTITILRFLHGIPFGMSTTAIQTVASDLMPDERRGEGMAHFSVTITLAMIIGPSLYAFGNGDGKFSGLFILVGILSLCGLIPAVLTRTPGIRDKTASFSLSRLIEPKMGSLALTVTITYAAVAAVLGFIPLYGESLALDTTGWFFPVFGIGMLVSRVATGKTFDRYGPRLPFLVGLGLWISATFILAGCRTNSSLLLSALISGVGMGMFAPPLYAMSVNLTTAARRGVANSMIPGSMDLGSVIGGYLFGYIAQAFSSYHTMYFVAAIILFLPAVLFNFLVVPDYQRNTRSSKG